MVALREEPGPADPLERLAGALDSLDLGVSSPYAAERDRLVGILRSYLAPRALDPAFPLTVVFAGPTGAGKSTIVNSLIGIDMSDAGVLRPTTTRPVVVAASDRASDYSRIADVECDVEEGKAPVLDNLVLIDTPDVDSTALEHRRVAETLIDNADVVVFVTSALRYSDAVPWQVMRRAVSRGTSVIQVLNRVTSTTAGAVVDLRSRLRAAGLDDDIVAISEHHLQRDAQQLPALAIKALRRRLSSLVDERDTNSREIFRRVLVTTLQGVQRLALDVEEIWSTQQSWEAEMSIEVSRRVADLDLTSAAGVCPPLSDSSPRSIRRWRRSGRKVGILEANDTESLVRDVVAGIHNDLRRWSGGGTFDEIDPDLEVTIVVPGLLPVASQAVSGWVDYVRRIAEEVMPHAVGLAERALIDAVLRNDDASEATALFGPDTDIVVGRADRELRGRLEVVYGQLAEHVSNRQRESLGEPDDAQLDKALVAMEATYALASG